ncbi:hypothetical protein DD599_26695 [Enterobacter cloacae complex sp. CH23B]|nr:hypothetical protein DD599_26695 [Enterobacter cloacae complex sp. CH23B]
MLLMQGQAPATWVYLKQMLASAPLSNEFEGDVMTDWYQLTAATCIEEYDRRFCIALLSVTSYRFVPLTKQIEKYCCELPKGLQNYCTKN